ncbi:MAG: hypothetical protein Kow0025_20960 [Thermodesulfovibrionales bacterium]
MYKAGLTLYDEVTGETGAVSGLLRLLDAALSNETADLEELKAVTPLLHDAIGRLERVEDLVKKAMEAARVPRGA